MKKKTASTVIYVLKSLKVVIGIVLIWRGVWYILDQLDLVLFDGNTLPLAAGGIVLGLLILYFPNKSLDVIKKL